MATSVPKSALASVYLTLVLDLLGFGIILPQLPLLARSFGVSDFAVASLSAVFSFAHMIGALVWGGLSDRLGRKKVIVFCIVGKIIFFALMGFAKSITYI